MNILGFDIDPMWLILGAVGVGLLLFSEWD
jgi:hypothetical protein